MSEEHGYAPTNHFRITDRCIHLALVYPNVGSRPNVIEIELEDVRASDGIRIEYDFDRDGWVIKQPREIPSETEFKEEWAETAFVQSWALEPTK